MVTNYQESASTLNMRAWVASEHYWDLRFDLYRNALQVLRGAGLKTPIPLREVQATALLAGAAETGPSDAAISDTSRTEEGGAA
jgi:small-conductance mechanosensitive channel